MSPSDAISLKHQAEAAGCTEAETEAAVLHDLGWGYRRIATHQGVAMTTVRDRVKRAVQKIDAYQSKEET